MTNKRHETGDTNDAALGERDLLEEALVRHKAGRLAEAERLYKQILKAEPDHPQALHFLGVAADQMERHEEAVDLIRESLALKPEYVAAYNNLGNALDHAGRADEAIEAYGKALSLDPDYASAHNNLGAVLRDQGRPDDAETAFRRAGALQPGNAGVHNSLGDILKARGKLDEAARAFREAIALKPDYAEARSNLGATLQRQGKLDEAMACHAKAVALAPDSHQMHTNLGNTLLAQEKAEEAAEAYRKAVQLKPAFAEGHNNLGTALMLGKTLEVAEGAFRRAIELKPDFADAHCNLGSLLRERGDFDAAAASFGRAVEIRPDFAEAHCNMGLAFREQEKFEDAVNSYLKAIELRPDYADAHDFLGNAYYYLGRLEDALACHNQALELNPQHATARFNRAILNLTLGRFAEGWKDYRARHAVRERVLDLQFPVLEPDLSGRDIFLCKDQGLGDEIFFLRFAPELKARGATITYQAAAKIRSIVERLPFLDAVVGEDTKPQIGQLTISVGDLPYLLGMTSVADIPPPYDIPVEPGRAEAMAARLADLGPAPYVGLTWRAGLPKTLGSQARGSLHKEVVLEDLGRALRDIGGTFLGLQRLPAEGEIAALADAIGGHVHDFTALNDDLDDMLALLALIDDYVTVSNTNVHLRAGTGRTSLVLVPSPPEWRWMAEGTESPWFPGSSVYRQGRDWSWAEAFAALGRDVTEALTERKR